MAASVTWKKYITKGTKTYEDHEARLYEPFFVLFVHFVSS